MLTQKINKTKNLILTFVLVIIVIIIFFLVFKFFILNKKTEADKSVDVDILSEPENFKPLDTSLFSDPKFKNLIDNSFKDIDKKNLDIGKKNPFL